jgi:tetratricopeptide (TPR) repeat protein
MSAKIERDTGSIIETVQKTLLYVFVAVLPISILPFPWDLTEKGMTIVTLFFTLVIVGLEIAKAIWTGKVAFLKRETDLILFLLFVSLILTTIFAQDSNLSLFGYNYRLSAGLVGIGAILLLMFVVRNFLSTKKDLLNLFNAFFVGSILTSFLSLVSLFGANIFNIIPKIGLLDMEGFPLLGSPVILVIYNAISVFLAYISLQMYKADDEEMDASWFAIVTILINVGSLTLFSVNDKAFLVSIVFLATWILVLVAMFLKEKKLDFKAKIKQTILPVSLLLLVTVVQIKAVQNLILGDKEILSSLNLSLDFSWQVVSQSLMRSLKNGIFGLGLDSFGVIFTALKPVELLNVNLTNAYNEILTSLSNSGFLWLVIWIVLGWYILKDLLRDIREYSSKYKTLVLFDTLLLFIYLTSFLTTYTVILRLTFFLMISSGVVLRSIFKNQEVDNLLLKIWTMGTGKKEDKSLPLISIFFTVAISLLLVLGIVRLGRITMSSLYLLRAESYISKEQSKLEDREPTLEEEEEITSNLYRWYSKALKYDKSNPLVNRKISTVAVDNLKILMQRYEDTEDEKVLNDAVQLRSEAFEYSREAINLSPSLYSSYNNRALVYLGIINLGYTEYIRDAISVINEAIEMNPLDYQNYYNKAQLYYILQNHEQALSSSTQALSIKGDYIPALILSANINGIQGKTEIQLSYLEAAKTILEKNELENLDLYGDILEQIELIRGGSEEIEEIEEPMDLEKSVDQNEDVPEKE